MYYYIYKDTDLIASILPNHREDFKEISEEEYIELSAKLIEDNTENIIDKKN